MCQKPARKQGRYWVAPCWELRRSTKPHETFFRVISWIVLAQGKQHKSKPGHYPILATVVQHQQTALQKVLLACLRPTNAGSADVSSAPIRGGYSDIEDSQRFSRYALSADGTSAFPAIDCLFPTRVPAGRATWHG